MTTFVMPDKSLSWPICWEGVQLIAESESCKYNAEGLIITYRDSVGILTGPWGITTNIKASDTWTQEVADKMFCDELTNYANKIKKLITNDATPEEFAAMCSLAWNIGVGAFSKSTVLKQHNLGNYENAARAFNLWNKAGGRVVRGLTARRLRESSLYLSGDNQHVNMAQQVDRESHVADSPIIQSGAITGGIGGVTAAAQYSDSIHTIASNIGFQPVYIVAAALVVVGGVAIYQRLKQRSQGWA